jgi:D-arginine dehydrogenase
MEVDVHGLHQGFLRGAKAQGAHLWCDAEVLQALRSPFSSHSFLSSPCASNSQQDWRIDLHKSDSIQCGIIVNASGAWGDVVAQRCGVQMQGLTPKRRSALTFPATGLDCKLWPLVNSLDETYYFKPDAGQLLGSPANADPCPPHDVQPEEMDIASAIAHIESATHLQIRRPTRTWAGLRTFAPSGEPVLGYDRMQPGFFWLVGQGGYGIQTCAALSELAAWELQAGDAGRTFATPPSVRDLPHNLVREGLRYQAFAPQ